MLCWIINNGVNADNKRVILLVMGPGVNAGG
jgi:hypothetical protein